jgi:hypothetical protein
MVNLQARLDVNLPLDLLELDVDRVKLIIESIWGTEATLGNHDDFIGKPNTILWHRIARVPACKLEPDKEIALERSLERVHQEGIFGQKACPVDLRGKHHRNEIITLRPARDRQIRNRQYRLIRRLPRLLDIIAEPFLVDDFSVLSRD